MINGIANNAPPEITFKGVQVGGSHRETQEIKGFGVAVDHTRNTSSGTYETEITLEVTSATVLRGSA